MDCPSGEQCCDRQCAVSCDDGPTPTPTPKPTPTPTPEPTTNTPCPTECCSDDDCEVSQSFLGDSCQRTEHAKTETAFPTPPPQSQAQLLMVVSLLMVVTQLQPLQPASFSAVQMTTAKRVLSARTVSARSLARMMPTAMVPTKSAIPPMTTASTALQTISVKMVALVTPIAGRMPSCSAAHSCTE